MNREHLYKFRCHYTGVVKAYKRMSSRKAEERNGLLAAEGSTHRWTTVAAALPDENGSRPQAKRRATADFSPAPRVIPAPRSGTSRPP